jgi:regulator of replication initiation timing
MIIFKRDLFKRLPITKQEWEETVGIKHKHQTIKKVITLYNNLSDVYKIEKCNRCNKFYIRSTNNNGTICNDCKLELLDKFLS